MKIGKLTITASGWPWQIRPKHWATDNGGKKWGWRNCDGMGRFGGGWNYKLGFMASRQTLIIELLFGSIRLTTYQPKA